MKRFLFAGVLVALTLQQNLLAQLPQTSSSTEPVWYYIQTKGSENDREDRVFTVEGTSINGRKISETLTDAQLWRFEKENDDYILISKTGEDKRADVVYDATRSIRHLSVSADPSTKFSLSSSPGAGNENLYVIAVTNPPAGGTASEIYAHQANAGGSRDYVIMLVGTNYYAGLNSAFSFVPYDALNLEYSTDKKQVWYTIHSASDKLNNACMTDASDKTDPDIRIAVDTPENGNDRQLWKLVQKENSRIDLINKSTGNLIQTRSDLSESDRPFNFTQLTKDPAESSGWLLQYAGNGQYLFSGEEEDGITRYLHASTDNSTPESYDAGNLLFSAFAWKFNKNSTSGGVSIGKVDSDNDVRIRVEERRIIVTGAEQYTVRTIQGITINPSVTLPTGVYLVTANGTTTKIIVN